MKVIFFFSFLFLAACSASKPISVNYKPIIPSLPPPPDLPIKNLHINSSYSDVVKSYVSAVKIQKSYIDEVNLMIDSLHKT